MTFEIHEIESLPLRYHTNMRINQISEKSLKKEPRYVPSNNFGKNI